MTRLLYISPSLLPSRTANSIHVVQQCAALAEVGADVTLVARHAVPSDKSVQRTVAQVYGVDAARFRLAAFRSPVDRAGVLQIALYALIVWLRLRPRPGVILSRNLYAAFLLAVVARKPMLFETHELEFGVRKRLQRAVMTCRHVTTVVISEKLAAILAEHHGTSPTRSIVLHDAAPPGIVPLPRESKRARLVDLFPQLAGDWRAVCGYFGHLYRGRGVEVIEALAARRPDVMFLLVGGTDADVAAWRRSTSRDNLVFAGFVSYPIAQQAMAACDVLLMPYQRSVSLGVGTHDTARWMSPMKMFEYLASGTPIISSDLPVLREVLTDNETALLAEPEDPEAWRACLDRLLDDPDLARRLGENGHALYRNEHNWIARAERLLEAGRAPGRPA